MILTEVTGEDRYPRLVMDRFVRPQRRVLLEFLTRDYEELPGSEGDIRKSRPCHRVHVVCDALGTTSWRHGDDCAGVGSPQVAS